MFRWPTRTRGLPLWKRYLRRQCSRRRCCRLKGWHKQLRATLYCLPVALLFLQRDKPEIDFVDPGNVFVQDRLVSVLVDVGSAVAALKVGNDLVKFVDLGVHDAQV